MIFQTVKMQIWKKYEHIEYTQRENEKIMDYKQKAFNDKDWKSKNPDDACLLEELPEYLPP